MSKLNNQLNALRNIDAVQDLTNENAASISGGADVTIYDDLLFLGDKAEINEGQMNLGGFDNKTSSIKVDSVVNKKTWRFYKEPNFQGDRAGIDYIDVKPGEELACLPQSFDNQISSLKSIG